MCQRQRKIWREHQLMIVTGCCTIRCNDGHICYPGVDMAKVSIAQAAKMVGISRTTMYRKFINSGSISVEAVADGLKQIDTSELMRVFGTLNGGQAETVSIASDGQLVTPGVTHENKALEAKLKEALELLRVREVQLDEAKLAEDCNV